MRLGLLASSAIPEYILIKRIRNRLWIPTEILIFLDDTWMSTLTYAPSIHNISIKANGVILLSFLKSKRLGL
jgi:hypothetical protein